MGKPPIKIVHAGIGEQIVRGRKHAIIRGTLLSEYFPEKVGAVVIPEYQRMAMTNTPKHAELKTVVGPDGLGIPDDLLCCVRTDQFRPVGGGEVILGANQLFLLDGHQRMVAARSRLLSGQHVQPLGVKIILGTTEREEVEIFYQVNRLQTKVSTDVHLRNSGTNPAIEVLFALSKMPGFPVVRWDQLKVPGEKITAHMLFETTIILHGYSPGKPIEDILFALEEVAKKYGTGTIAYNMKTFFEVLEAIFSSSKDLSKYTYRVDLLRGLAKLFSKYNLFWDKKNPNRLAVSKQDIHKLQGLSVRILERNLELAGATNAVFNLLYNRLQSQREPFEQRAW